MASFRDMFFTPAEFANIAKIDRNLISALESEGKLRTTKRKMGNVDRKMIALEDMQQYFRNQGFEAVAVATDARANLKHKIQMFYNVKGGTGKSTLTAQCVMRAAMMGLKVLAIDLDGQGHLTVNLDVLDAHERPTVYDVLINDLPISEA